MTVAQIGFDRLSQSLAVVHVFSETFYLHCRIGPRYALFTASR